DTLHILDTWWNNAIFQHCLLIPPIIAYLVWIRRHEVAALAPKPFLPALVPMLIGGLGWLLGALADVAVVRETALIGMLIVSVPLVLGLTVARGLTFPLFYALFLIPAGDQLIPWLQLVTADICIFLLDLFDVPAFIDGTFIQIPNGRFEVAEACSGVRFLIAMVAFSTLVAHLCFKSTLRRIVCVLSAIILSILANGLRAWGTIYISFLTTPKFAAGVDHVVYGWFFFAIIMAIVLGVGWFFFDRPVDDPAFDPQHLQKRPAIAPAVPALAVAALLGLFATAAAPVVATVITNPNADATVAAVDLPDLPGWTKVDAGPSGWTPLYDNASVSAFQRYRNADGAEVDLYIAAYDRQSSDREMITYGNGLLEPDGDWTWSRNIADPPGGTGTQIQGRPWIRDVWRWYLVGDEVTGSDYRGKLALMKNRLTGGPTRAGVLIISGERIENNETTVPAMAAFLDTLGDPKAAILAATVEDRVVVASGPR
ncbi:MAG: exosortase A, partial [Pseudomonadota bacterium]